MSHTNKWIARTIAGLILAVLPVSQAAADVVVAVSGPSAKSYPVGKKIGANDKIVLQSGDTLTVLGANGTRVLRGSGTYVLSDAATSDRSGAFALITRQRSAQRMRTGAVRGDAVGPTSRPNIWYVDVRQAGPMCIADTSEVRLWRPVTSGEQLYAIGMDSKTAASKANFNDGDMITVWDLTQAPITDGSSYVIAGGDGKPNEITFRVLDAVPDDAEELAAKLIEKGCTAQLDVLATALAPAE